MSRAETRIAIIGAGNMGAIHARSLATVPDARLVAVVDVLPEAVARLAEEAGVPVYPSLESLRQAGDADAVVIATPAETHAEIIEEAADAGLHVLCEKPLDCRLEAVDRALAAVERAGTVLQVGFNRRFDRSFARLQQEIAAGVPGDLVSVHIVSRDPLLPGPPRTMNGMSGLFFDTSIHDFDMLRFVTGSEIAMVHVLASSAVHGQGAMDTALMLVRMANGVVATIDNSQAAYGYDQRVEVFGSTGLLSVANERADGVSFADATGFHGPLLPYFYPERYRESYVEQMRAFVAFVRHGTPPAPSATDGRAATVAALAAQRSVDQERPVLVSEVG